MTHQEILKKAQQSYSEYVIANKLQNSPILEDFEVFIVWSCKTANNSKFILADSLTNTLCEVTFIGSRNLLIFDYYDKTKHIECEP